MSLQSNNKGLAFKKSCEIIKSMVILIHLLLIWETRLSVYPKGKMSPFVLCLSPLFNSDAREGNFEGSFSSKRNLRQFCASV